MSGRAPWFSSLRKRWLLWRLLRATYTREGCRIWLRHHRKQGTSLDEQLRIAETLATGAFA